MGPPPAGVPVRITSPGSRVTNDDTYETSVATSRTMRLVVESCTSAPSRRVRISSSPTSSSVRWVTIHGPRGQNVIEASYEALADAYLYGIAVLAPAHV